MICPYCEHEYEPECESYSEDESVEKCSGCGKKYHAHQSFSVDHHAEPDCELNGEHHQWEDHDMRDGTTHPFCSVCGKCGSVKN